MKSIITLINIALFVVMWQFSSYLKMKILCTLSSFIVGYSEMAHPLVTLFWSEVAYVWVFNLHQCHYAVNFMRLLPFSHNPVFQICSYCYRYIEIVAFNCLIVFQNVNLLLLSFPLLFQTFYCSNDRYLGSLLLSSKRNLWRFCSELQT